MSGAANPTQARATPPPLGTSSPLASLPLARARCPSAAAMDGAKLLEQAIHVVRIKTGGTTCRQVRLHAAVDTAQYHRAFIAEPAYASPGFDVARIYRRIDAVLEPPVDAQHTLVGE